MTGPKFTTGLLQVLSYTEHLNGTSFVDRSDVITAIQIYFDVIYTISLVSFMTVHTSSVCSYFIIPYNRECYVMCQEIPLYRSVLQTNSM